MYDFARAAITEHHKRGGSNNKSVLFHSSGEQKSKTEVSAGLFLSENCEGDCFRLLLASNGC